MSRKNVASPLALAPLAVLVGLSACGGVTPPPKELEAARKEFGRANSGVTLQLDPTDVHEAQISLQTAEDAWKRSGDPSDTHAIDLAIIAQHKAQIAEAEAAAMRAQKEAEQAKADLAAVMAAQLQATRGQLNKTQLSLQQTQADLERKAAEAAEQKKQLADLEAKLKDARDTIAKIAAVKDDDRGMVITLQGEVLFKTGKWDLKAGAMAKLDQIADALRGKEQPMTVFGFTDNVGAYDMNMDLSQKRAQSVRDYLVSKGIPQDLVSAQGKGPNEPVAGNDSVEGRAQNRRVEIVVKPKGK